MGKRCSESLCFQVWIKGESHHTLPEWDILIKHDLSSHRLCVLLSPGGQPQLFQNLNSILSFLSPDQPHPCPLARQSQFVQRPFWSPPVCRRKESVLRSCAQVGSRGNRKVHSRVEVGSVSKDLWQGLLPSGPLSFARKKNIFTMKSSKTNPLARCYCEGLFYSEGRSQR